MYLKLEVPETRKVPYYAFTIDELVCVPPYYFRSPFLEPAARHCKCKCKCDQNGLDGLPKSRLEPALFCARSAVPPRARVYSLSDVYYIL